MYSKITQLCNLVNETEWSALLFFTAKGHPIDPEGLECTLVDLHLQDIGTPGYTAFKNDVETMMDLYEKKPHLEDCRMGIIHSHHNMKTFYSGVDMSELHDNSNGVDFYLSVVVNNRPEWIAKAVYQVEEAASRVSWRQDGEIKTVSTQSRPIVAFRSVDMKVFIEPSDVELSERVKELIKKNNEKPVSVYNPMLTRGTEPTVRSLAEESFDKWRSRHSLPHHVSPKQKDLFTDKTIAELFAEESGVALEEEIATMEEIAKACISMQPEEEREIHTISAQIRKHIGEKEIEIYVDEVIDTADQIYLHYTNAELTESSRASLYREMIALADERDCPPLDALVTALKREINLIRGIDDREG